MAVIYFIIIFLGILAVGLAINKPFRQQLNLKFHGRTEAIMAENASTPEGAEDIFSAAIQEKQKKFEQINNLYSEAEGRLDALKSDKYSVNEKLNKAQNNMNRCLDDGNDEDAKYYAAQKVSLEEQLEIIKTSIEETKVDVAQKKELKTKVFEAPFVRFRDSSNSCSVPLVEVIVVSRIIGFNSGTVILKKVCSGLAPSIFAAS